MKLILICLFSCLLFLSGCVNVSYTEKTFKFVNNKPVLMTEKKISYSSCNVNIEDKKILIDLKNNTIDIYGRILAADPNSAIAEGQAAGNVISGGTSGAASTIIKDLKGQ